jgi:hypothetical protein
MQIAPDISVSSFLSIPKGCLPNYIFVCLGEIGSLYHKILSFGDEVFPSFYVHDDPQETSGIHINNIQDLYTEISDLTTNKSQILICSDASNKYLKSIISGIVFNDKHNALSNINICSKSNISVLCIYTNKKDLFHIATLAHSGIVNTVFAEKQNTEDVQLSVYKTITTYKNYLSLSNQANFSTSPKYGAVDKLYKSPIVKSDVIQFEEFSPQDLIEKAVVLSISKISNDINIKNIVALVKFPQSFKESTDINGSTFLLGVSTTLKHSGFSQYTQAVCYSEDLNQPQIFIFCGGSLKAK